MGVIDSVLPCLKNSFRAFGVLWASWFGQGSIGKAASLERDSNGTKIPRFPRQKKSSWGLGLFVFQVVFYAILWHSFTC